MIIDEWNSSWHRIYYGVCLPKTISVTMWQAEDGRAVGTGQMCSTILKLSSFQIEGFKVFEVGVFSSFVDTCRLSVSWQSSLIPKATEKSDMHCRFSRLNSIKLICKWFLRMLIDSKLQTKIKKMNLKPEVRPWS